MNGPKRTNLPVYDEKGARIDSLPVGPHALDFPEGLVIKIKGWKFRCWKPQPDGLVLVLVGAGNASTQRKLENYQALCRRHESRTEETGNDQDDS